MTVTELVTIRLLPGITTTNETLLSNLQKAKVIQKQGSGYPIHFLYQIEDPSVIYFVGQWDSPQGHMAYIVNPENRAAVGALMKDLFDMTSVSMFHIAADGQAPAIPLDAPAISISQLSIKKGERTEFVEEFGKSKPLVDAAPGKAAGGWRVEKKAQDEDEFVLFSGWESVEQHLGFGRSEEFEQYKTFLKHVESYEVTHGKEFAL